MVTLRVYDAGAKWGVDRYTLYVPTPRNLVPIWGYQGMGLGFSWGKETITRCCWFEVQYGVMYYNLGKKLRRNELPAHVQKWVKKMEDTYNKALTLDTDEAWEEWDKC